MYKTSEIMLKLEKFNLKGVEKTAEEAIWYLNRASEINRKFLGKEMEYFETVNRIKRIMNAMLERLVVVIKPKEGETKYIKKFVNYYRNIFLKTTDELVKYR